MSTIPASQIVNVLPSVLNAGGNALELIGLCLTRNTRVLVGQVLSFPTALSVSAFFGPSSDEYKFASIYFLGFVDRTAVPAALLFAQYNQDDVAAYVRGANARLTIPQIQALNQAIAIVMDGYSYSAGAFSLAAATSYTAAATLIQTALNTSLPAAASFTGAIAAATFSITATIDGELMNVTAVGSGVVTQGAVISGTGVISGTQVGTQVSGTTGGIGVYAISKLHTVPVVSETISGTYGTLTVSAVASGTLSIGQEVAGGSTAAGTFITALGTGLGLTGTYFVNLTQTVGSTSLTTTAPPLSVTYDSISGGFVITSGSVGAPNSTAAYPTGALATSLYLTQALGAVLSQGADAAVPSAFMNAIINVTTNWATFTTLFDPDGGSGNAVKLQFSAWVNGTDDEFMYVAWDSDITPTESTNASTSMGQVLIANQSSGTYLQWGPDYTKAAFVMGTTASIDFEAANGRITFAFRRQTGLVAEVTDPMTAANLLANGYNFYGAYATANQPFVWEYNGSVSGPFQWANTYVNQIWLSAQLQLALMELLQNTKSIPYNLPGTELIAAAMQDPINAALNFGAIRSGIPLSSAQIDEINTASGTLSAAPAITAKGYYVQVLLASPQVRQARGTPPINFWYTDGGDVQRISVAAIDVQ